MWMNGIFIRPLVLLNNVTRDTSAQGRSTFRNCESAHFKKPLNYTLQLNYPGALVKTHKAMYMIKAGPGVPSNSEFKHYSEARLYKVCILKT